MGEYRNKQFDENVSSIYEKIVYWNENFYLLVKVEDAL